MRPLPKFAIFDMATKAQLPNHVNRDLLYSVSGAHPLAVRYYIQRLADTSDESEANLVMSEDGLGTDIFDMYERVWGSIDPSSEAKKVLALLSRSDNYISPDELAEAVNDEAVEDVLEGMAFLLSGCQEGQLTIFHNSFRIFLASRTRRRFARDTRTVEHDLNNVLADIANRASRSSGQRWLELRYLARAGAKHSVRKLATPELFRQQLAEFRPPTDVYTDLRLAFGALCGQIDLSKFLQLILAEKEIDYRVEALAQIDLIQLHLTMEKERHAFSMAMASAEGTEGTYDLLDRLVASNDSVRARQLFDAIEPVEHFFAVDDHHLYSPDFSVVCRWVERAFHFRSLENIIGLVGRFPTVDDRHQRVRPYLLYLLGRGIVIDDPRRDIHDLSKVLGLHMEDELKLLVQAVVCAGKGKDTRRLSELLDRILPNARALDDECAQLCARYSLDIGRGDFAELFVATLELSATSRFYDYEFRSEISGLLENAFRVAGLFQRLSKDVPFTGSDDDVFQNRLLNAVIEFGKLYVRDESAMTPQDIEILEAVDKICFLWALGTPTNHHNRWDMFGPCEFEWLADTLVKVASSHSAQLLEKVELRIEALYARGSNRISGSSVFRLRFAKSAYAEDKDRCKATKRILAVENQAERELTPHQAADFRVTLVDAFCAVGAFKLAEEQLVLIHGDSLGYWLAAKKEPQYLFWNESFESACSTGAAFVRKYGSEYCRFVVGLADTEGSDTGARVSYGLLKETVRAPDLCAGLIDRLWDSGLANWGKLVGAILHGVATSRKELAPVCFFLYNRLVIPFTSDSAYSCIGPIHALLPTELRRQLENDFVECALKFADTSKKVELLQNLANVVDEQNGDLQSALRDVEAEFKEFMHAEPDTDSSSTDEWEREYENIHSLSVLCQAELRAGKDEGLADYYYKKRARKLVEDATREEILHIVDRRPKLKEDILFVIAASGRLLDLNAPVDARQFYKLAEENRSQGHWSRWFGGEKVAFERLRIKIEGASSEGKGLEELVADFASGSTSAGSVIPYLFEILSVVKRDVQWECMWREIAAHIAQYREYTSQAPIEPVSSVTSEESLLGHIVAKAFGLGCNSLTDRLRESLWGLGNYREGVNLFDCICSAMLSDERNHRELAAALWRQRRYAPLSHIGSTCACVLIESDDVVVCELARRLSSKQMTRKRDQTPRLPLIYEMEFVDDGSATSFSAPEGVDSDETFWSNDPWYWTHYLEFPIVSLSKMSGISIGVLRRRCAEIMRQNSGADTFGPSATSKQLRALNALGLMFPYRKLLPMAGFMALGVVVEELYLAQRIDGSVVRFLWPYLGGPSLGNFNIGVRPKVAEVSRPRLPKCSHWEVKAKDWLDLGGDNTVIPVIKNDVVIAEQSHFVIRGSRKRCSVIRTTLPRWDWEHQPDEELFYLPGLRGVDDMSLVGDGGGGGMICGFTDGVFGEVRDVTMTFSPRLLAHFRWQRSKDNPLEVL